MKKVVGIAGAAGAGKDTAGLLLTEILPNCETFSFAEPLYNLSEALLGRSLKDRDTKETSQCYHITQDSIIRMREVYESYELHLVVPFVDAYSDFMNRIPEHILPTWDLYAEFCMVISPRKMLQHLGQIMGREILYEEVWIDVLKRSLKQSKCEVAVITDVRHINEVNFVKDNNGILLKMHCPYNIHATKTKHISAQDIPTEYVDHNIVNNKVDIHELKEDLQDFCIDFSLGI